MSYDLDMIVVSLCTTNTNGYVPAEKRLARNVPFSPWHARSDWLDNHYDKDVTDVVRPVAPFCGTENCVQMIDSSFCRNEGLDGWGRSIIGVLTRDGMNETIHLTPRTWFLASAFRLAALGLLTKEKSERRGNRVVRTFPHFQQPVIREVQKRNWIDSCHL